ncbi:MAG TPA: AmmeMemoRadiSam system radical SAM enzyme [Candidatus Hydrogenedentes bacterium]|nr:AmmeMemoRadiSam system radical SAM enzyme [Candidatus Hydrogenedentota bacterium]HOS02813.1 AmmeMemoRadiSam system radical SAM enzyme [Candidatus Hydrogenedentota bacterium]
MSKRLSLREWLEQHTILAAPELTRQEGHGTVRCLACANRCLIPEGQTGICRVRANRDGALRVPGGYVAALHVDPIEKKPFFHAYPGRDALSFGMVGCDFTCGFCQNWVSSQVLRDDNAEAYPRTCAPDEIVSLALARGAPVVVSTYNEPLITTDWAIQIFEPAKQAGLVCGYVSNGNATPETLDYIRPYVDLYKVDLKTFNARHYRDLGGELSNILAAIERIKALGFWLEIVTLVVPDYNDSEEELRSIAKFIAALSTDIPWHVTAFHPDYKMSGKRRTGAAELDRAYAAGIDAGLKFVYEGNVPGRVPERENTRCPACGATLIRRHGFYITENRMNGGNCPDCDAAIPGMWETTPPRMDRRGEIGKRTPLS